MSDGEGGLPVSERALLLRISPSKPHTIELARGSNSVHITNASLQRGSSGGACLEISTGTSTSRVTVAQLDQHCKQFMLDLTFFPEDEKLTLYVTGKGPIHVLGNIISEPAQDEDQESHGNGHGQQDGEDDDESDDEDYTGQDAEDDDEDDGQDDEEDDEEDEEDEEEEEEAPPPAKTKKRSRSSSGEKQLEKEQRREKKLKQEKKKKQKKQQEKAKNQVKTLAGGLKIQIVKPGNGKTAKSGKKIRVHYKGQLTNGKVFDQSRGQPLSFRLGVGEVIKGFDQGIVGMVEGEHRRLTIPSKLAYGKRGAGKDIPPNSTLVFDIQLVSA